MTNTTAELETRIEQMVAEHVAAVRKAAQAAVERAFAGASASELRPDGKPFRIYGANWITYGATAAPPARPGARGLNGYRQCEPSAPSHHHSRQSLN